MEHRAQSKRPGQTLLVQSSLVDYGGFGLESRWVVCARPRTNESIKKTESRAWLAVELVDHYTQSRRSMHCKHEVNLKSCEFVLGLETPVPFCLEWDHNKYEGERIDLQCRVSRRYSSTSLLLMLLSST